jgi:hypothetical protein
MLYFAIGWVFLVNSRFFEVFIRWWNMEAELGGPNTGIFSPKYEDPVRP